MNHWMIRATDLKQISHAIVGWNKETALHTYYTLHGVDKELRFHQRCSSCDSSSPRPRLSTTGPSPTVDASLIAAPSWKHVAQNPEDPRGGGPALIE